MTTQVKGASKADPGTPTASPGKVSYDVLKVPRPAKTGSETVDTDAEARHGIMMRMFKEVMCDRNLVLPLYNTLQDRLRARDDAIVTDTSTFAKISTVSKTCPEFSVYHLAQVSDLTVQQLVNIRKKDEGAIAQLLCYDCQLHPNLKLSKECAVKDFWAYFLKSRSKALGNRLSNARKSGIVNLGAASLDWVRGSYELVFDKTKLTEIVHRSTNDRVSVGEEFHITTAWSLICNFSDWDAAVQLKPMPAVKLTSFFKSPAGPFQVKNYGCKVGEFAKDIGALFAEWDTERRSHNGGDGSMDLARAGLAEITNERRNESLKRARDKADDRAALGGRFGGFRRVARTTDEHACQRTPCSRGGQCSSPPRSAATHVAGRASLR